MNELEFAEQAPHLREVMMTQCLGMGIVRDEAEDIAQEALIRLWHVHGSLETSSSHEALARTIARRLSLNALRKKRIVPFEALNAARHEAHDGGNTIEEQEQLELLMSKIKALPASQGSILYLRHVEGMSKQEIAGILGIKESSVNTLLARARKNLIKDVKNNKI